MTSKKAKAAARGAASGRAHAQYRWTCRECDKYVYASKSEARGAIRALPGDRAEMNAYRCPEGEGWHVGHNMWRRRDGGE